MQESMEDSNSETVLIEVIDVANNYVEEFTAELSESPDQIDECLDETNDNLDQANESLDQTNASLDQTNASLNQANASLNQTNASFDQTNESADQTIEILSAEIDNVIEDSSAVISNFHLVKVENLLERKFLDRSFEEQMEIKKLGPYKPKNIKITQAYKTDSRNFSSKWFDRVEWLTVNETNNKFYCFYCLLFNGDSVWSKEGYNSIKNLSEKTKIHDSSKMHLMNALKFKCFGKSSTTFEVTVQEADVKRHNEMVDKNRHVLGRLFDCVKFCVAHNMQPKLEPNQKIFSNLAQEIAKFDPVLRESLQNSFPVDYTNRSVENDFLASINSIYQEEIKSDIEKVEFVALLVEKLEQRNSSVDHFALILRYLKSGLPTERFFCFISCKTKNVEELAFNIRKELLPLNLVCKLIAQCYDGYISVRGPYGGIQDSLKKFFPHALFMHSHSHSYERIIRQSCSYIPCIQNFFANVFKFSDFFFPLSKQFKTLNFEYIKNPTEVEDLQLNTESEIIKVLYLNEKELLETFQKIKTEFGWSDKSVYEATQLEALLKDQTFIFLMRLFFTIFKYVEVLTTTYKARITCGEIMSALKCFETAIANLMDVIKQAPESQHKTASIDACCIIITDIRERIEGSDHLLTFAVVNPKKYKQFPRFPQDHVKVLECKYRMLVPVKLGNELRVLHKSESPFAVKNECSLLNVLSNTGLQETFSEVCKLIEIVLVTPVSPVGTNKESGVTENLKEFVRNNWDDDQLLGYAELALHSDIIDNIYNFKSRVIEHFVNNGLNTENFLYKSYS